MKQIMVATDFSARSDRALRRAVLLAKLTGAELTLVHVVDDDQPRRIVDRELDIAAQYLGEQSATLRDVDGVPCRTSVLADTPFAGIVHAAEGADLLVLGPHRRQALLDAFAGTTAERTIRAAACPVLMANGKPLGHYRHILLGTDLSRDSRQVVERFLSLKIAGDARLSMLYVFDAPALRLAIADSLPRENREAYLQEEQDAANRDLAAFAAALGEYRIAHTVRFEASTVADEVLSAAEQASADLIVVGTRGRGGFARLFLGSVAAEVLRRADRDVLAIPPARGA